MYICPLCNGFDTKRIICRNCQNELIDSGKISDYYDDYSAYMEIDELKLENGHPDDWKNHICFHLFSCLTCGHDEVVSVKEGENE